MKKSPRGFTLLEVSLFLALSGFLMVGLIVGANISVSRQRYNDSVNSLGDFFRGVYSDVLNVSNDRTPSSELDGEDAGRTKTAIYGKLIIFGEQIDTGASGRPVYSEKIFSYDVVGNAVTSSTISATNTLEALRLVNADIIYNSTPETPASPTYVAFRSKSTTIPWEATMENFDGSQYRRMILIVRSPTSGTIHTYISSETNADGTPFSIPQVQFNLENNNRALVNVFPTLLGTYGGTSNTPSIFVERQIDICVDSDDLPNSDNRRNVRVNAFAANSSAVELVEQDSLYDATTNPKGSRCGGKG
ncbi:type II secretion system protein [Candidatus Saccharibacteria bacterium]|nr:type II secretion system protein [Candidatus Saccharibacteria bacterium]